MLRRRCRHESTLVVTSVGVRRSVCETCGHISFQMTEGAAATASVRQDFPRAAGL